MNLLSQLNLLYGDKSVGETEINKKLCMLHICRFLNSILIVTLLSIWKVSLSQSFYSQLSGRRRAGTLKDGTKHRQWILRAPSSGGFLPIHNFLLSPFFPSIFLFLCVSTYMWVCFCNVLDSKIRCPSRWVIATLNSALLCGLWISKRVKRFKWQDLNEKIVI